MERLDTLPTYKAVPLPEHGEHPSGYQEADLIAAGLPRAVGRLCSEAHELAVAFHAKYGEVSERDLLFHALHQMARPPKTPIKKPGRPGKGGRPPARPPAPGGPVNPPDPKERPPKKD